MSNEQTQVGAASTQSQIATRPPLPPFNRETAIQKVRLAEDAWNSRDPEKVALAYTIDSRWRNRAEFPIWTTGNHPIFETQMGERAGLPAHQRALGIQRKS